MCVPEIYNRKSSIWIIGASGKGGESNFWQFGGHLKGNLGKRESRIFEQFGNFRISTVNLNASNFDLSFGDQFSEATFGQRKGN